MAKNRPSLSKHSLLTSSLQNNSVLLYNDAADHGSRPHRLYSSPKLDPEAKASQPKQWSSEILFLLSVSETGLLFQWHKAAPFAKATQRNLNNH